MAYGIVKRTLSNYLLKQLGQPQTSRRHMMLLTKLCRYRLPTLIHDFLFMTKTPHAKIISHIISAMVLYRSTGWDSTWSHIKHAKTIHLNLLAIPGIICPNHWRYKVLYSKTILITFSKCCALLRNTITSIYIFKLINLNLHSPSYRQSILNQDWYKKYYSPVFSLWHYCETTPDGVFIT